MRPVLGRTFASLQVPNYRRYFAGQVVSISGNWMQTVAEMWLIVQLTGSGVAVGVTAALQFLPLLVLGAYGGLLADRFDKRRLLMITQACMVVPATCLWLVVSAGAVEAWMVYGLVLARGCVTAIDIPARQSFVTELVGRKRVVNAVALNSVIIHTARIAGPALAGLTIALAGVGPCFALNGLSFVVMVVALRGLDVAALERPERTSRGRGQIRSALTEVRRREELRTPLAMMVVVGTLSFNFLVLLPLFAAETWHGTASSYALLTSALGIGSVAGALAAGARGRIGPRGLVWAAAALGVAELAVAASPTLAVQALMLLPLGAISVTFAAGVNASLQLAAPERLRGRVMALYSIVFLGSTAIGGPLVGALAEVADPRAGLVLGGVAALAAASVAQVSRRRALAQNQGEARTFSRTWDCGPTPTSATEPPTNGSTSPRGRRRPRPRRRGLAARIRHAGDAAGSTPASRFSPRR